jgi:serine/threonine protein kinase
MKLSLGRYELKSVLGQGGLGKVYLAHDPAVGRDVAIKVIDLSGLDDRAYVVKRLQREVYSAGNISHPGIISIYDVGQEGDSAYIVMEFVHGMSLEVMIERGSLKPAQVRNILTQIAVALDYVHEKGIVHRDIKPSNILLNDSGSVKIADFGIARISISEKTTARNLQVGTLRYMAPEQYANAPVGAAADQYALAVTAFQMLTGAFPFEADSMAAFVFEVLHKSPASVTKFNPTLGPAVDIALARALSKQPEARYSTCGEFIATLMTACDKERDWNPDRRTGVEHPKTSPQITDSRPYEPSASETLGDTNECPNCGAPVGLAQLFCSKCGWSMNRIDKTLSTQVISNKTLISKLSSVEAPTDFVFSKTQFFDGDKARFEKIEESIRFYRNNLNSEYEGLSKQANLTYKLWIACVTLGFVILLAGIVLMFTAGLAKGLVTACSTIVVYFIQRIFQQREDFYRQSANEKSEHLRYGNQWLLIIQSIDSIQDPAEKMKRQARLVDVLTEKLGIGPFSPARPKSTAKRHPLPQPSQE